MTTVELPDHWLVPAELDQHPFRSAKEYAESYARTAVAAARAPLVAEVERLNTALSKAIVEARALQAQANTCGSGAGCLWKDAEMDRLCAELAARPAVPEGWQLVPKEPTPEMLLRAYKEIGIARVELADTYRTLIAAAPLEPK